LKRTHAPILVLVALLSTTAVGGAAQSIEAVAPGLRHLVISKGDVATAATYRIVIGEFERQADADLALERLQENGFTAFPISFGDEYYIVTPGLPHRTEAEDLRQRLLERGFSPPLEIREVSHDQTHANGPWSIHVLEADPTLVEVRVAHAYDTAIGLETTADLARRLGALAAINGGYFSMKGLFAGDSRGTLQINGRLISEPDRGRAAVGFFEREGKVNSVFGRLSFHGEVHLDGGERIPLDGLNRNRGSDEVILFTPDFHRTTLTSAEGAEITILDGRVAEILNGSGSTTIPPGGMVLSIGADRTQALLPKFRPRSRVSVETAIEPLLPDPEREWDQVEDIVSGGPLLLWKGTRLEEPEVESISNSFFLARHPRTAAGVRADGTLLFVTVDGRQPRESVGMSLPELTDLMVELGCVSAINLDGGGSTTMVIDGKIANRPSGGSARRNADAILLFPRKP
jgi:exopolysaccharide biosynthesis protein